MSNSTGVTTMIDGRIVWTSGDLFKGKPKLDFNTKQPKINAQGEPMSEYGFGLAVPKSFLNQTNPGEPGNFWALMHEQAYTLFPSKQLPPGFAMKYKDGDGVDHKGVSYANRPGHKDHIILACTTTIPIKWFKFDDKGEAEMINQGIKCGDFVRVQLNIKAHGAVGQGKSGLYLNPLSVLFTGEGDAIINTPSGNDIFGNEKPPVPQGARPVPNNPVQQQISFTMPQPTQQLNNGYQPNTGQLDTSNPPQGAPFPQPTAQPHYGVLPEQHQPQQVQQPVATPSPFPIPGQGN